MSTEEKHRKKKARKDGPTGKTPLSDLLAELSQAGDIVATAEEMGRRIIKLLKALEASSNVEGDLCELRKVSTVVLGVKADTNVGDLLGKWLPENAILTDSEVKLPLQGGKHSIKVVKVQPMHHKYVAALLYAGVVQEAHVGLQIRQPMKLDENLKLVPSGPYTVITGCDTYHDDILMDANGEVGEFSVLVVRC
jgi:hypothetical protein